jgi:transcriptional regulator with GAF, ATPase, and Fis domain
MIGTVRASSTDIYEAVLALSRLIAGHTDIESLLAGVRQALRRVVNFDYLGMMLPEREGKRMRLHVLSAAGPVETRDAPRFSVEDNPAGWVWLNQQPLVIRSIETRPGGRSS